ncbi:unnamed protein product [Rangifer tarandus platyrhynchus]|uniref:Uncharacterized protein n=1 Tax=Rangifer tarandus platyrhynchus TaxID=3082113 RepID=A0AC59ZAQ8_RANTA
MAVVTSGKQSRDPNSSTYHDVQDLPLSKKQVLGLKTNANAASGPWLGSAVGPSYLQPLSCPSLSRAAPLRYRQPVDICNSQPDRFRHVSNSPTRMLFKPQPQLGGAHTQGSQGVLMPLPRLPHRKRSLSRLPELSILGTSQGVLLFPWLLAFCTVPPPWAALVAQLVKNLPAMREAWVPSLGWEDPLEKGKAAHSAILAWRVLWMV